jgi:hypothetical protein
MLRIALAVALCLFVPSRSDAWGPSVHRYIMGRAIDLLPPDIKPFFEANRQEVVLRVNDPDLWRTAGWDENPNHFVDFGVKEYGAYPFSELPRDYAAALEKFGRATLKKNGLLPWREAEMFGELRRAFQELGQNRQYAAIDVILFTATASHYMQDAHVPFHATYNYDGQFTGQHGVHARFETELFDRFESRMTIRPAPPVALKGPRDAAFDALLSGYPLVQTVLDADKAAIQGKDVYDAPYFEQFFTRVKPLIEQRLSEAISATASLIVGAWEEAGRPPVRMPSPTIERVRPSK